MTNLVSVHKNSRINPICKFKKCQQRPRIIFGHLESRKNNMVFKKLRRRAVIGTVAGTGISIMKKKKTYTPNNNNNVNVNTNANRPVTNYTHTTSDTLTKSIHTTCHNGTVTVIDNAITTDTATASATRTANVTRTAIDTDTVTNLLKRITILSK